MTSLTHAVLVLLAPVAAAAMIGLYWGYQASKLSWPERPPDEREDKPLVCCLSTTGAVLCAPQACKTGRLRSLTQRLPHVSGFNAQR